MVSKRKPASVTVRRRSISLHGQRIAYAEAGSGPALILIHGVAEAMWVWDGLVPALGARHRVIALDLLGHGDSSKPRGDYSLGSQASLIRDLMIALDIESATFIGHSLGGGITMQFAYQYPERCDRMVLVASGGLGHDVTFLLRSLGLPGADLLAPLVLSARVRDWMIGVGGWLRRRGIRPGIAQAAMWRSYETLTDPETRRAFIATVSAVVDQRGQRVSAIERLYLARSLPTLVIWGDRDRIIPVAHARAAHAEMPGSRLEIIAGAGHFVCLEEPEIVAALVLDFLATTSASHLTPVQLRATLRAGPRRVAGR